MNFVDKSLELRKEVRRLILGWIHPQTLATEKARAELNAELQKHWGANAFDVYELIFETAEMIIIEGSDEKRPDKTSFIVFIDTDLDVDWISEVDMGRDAEKCVSFVESVGARRCKHLPTEQILELRRVIGQAIVNGIRGEKEQSTKLAVEAAQFLKDRTVERSRAWTLVSAHIFLILFSVGLASVCNILEGQPSYLGASNLLLIAIQGGVIGAYLSVIQRAGKGEWDAAAGRIMHYVEVFTKLFAGGTLGGIAFALSRSINAPPYLHDITLDGYSALIFGLVAGFLERLIPKMISQYSDFEHHQTIQIHET